MVFKASLSYINEQQKATKTRQNRIKGHIKSQRGSITIALPTVVERTQGTKVA